MDCVICGESLPDERPYHYLILGTLGSDPEDERIEERICGGCWDEYREKLF